MNGQQLFLPKLIALGLIEVKMSLNVTPILDYLYSNRPYLHT
jgi:hypothetical protein